MNVKKVLYKLFLEIMQFDWFLSVLEQKWLENYEIYYIEAAEYS